MYGKIMSIHKFSQDPLDLCLMNKFKLSSKEFMTMTLVSFNNRLSGLLRCLIVGTPATLIISPKKLA
jgi:hypothetical protein